MTIIVEGMDNTGKTTLIRALTDHLDSGSVPYFHREPRGPKSRGEDLQEIHLMLETTDVRIYDRTPVISELVYGHVLRGEGSLGDQSWHFLNVVMRSNPLLIYCRPPEEVIFEFGDREQMEGVIEKSKKLLDRYDFVMNAIRNLGFQPLVYDYTKHSLDYWVNLMTQHVQKIYLRHKVTTELDKRKQ